MERIKIGKGRVVAIVGRPNVGKSALFNRLAGRRIAIVHAESGVTRDRLITEVVSDGQRFHLIDTGGIGVLDGATATNIIDAGIHRQAQAAVEDAAACILVVDVTAGLTPLDENVARILRASGLPVFLAANKADDESHDAGALDFARLNLPLFAVSAEHNRGLEPLMRQVLAALPEAADADEAAPLKVAIVGRPNVGKSSFVNRLLRSDRVLVSDIPGTTRDSVDVPFKVGSGPTARNYLLIDTAGMRRPGKIDTMVERLGRMRAERSIRRADVVVLVLDAAAGPMLQDKKVGTLIAEASKGAIIIINKWDLMGSTQREYEAALLKNLPFMRHCPMVFVSAETGYNIRSSIEVIDRVAANTRMLLPTGTLNRVIQDAFATVHPPSVEGKALKIFYATQVGVAPVTVRIFVNHPRHVKDTYRDYLVRILRERFGLAGAPVLLEFRARRKED